jgi:hypothetical protein
VIAADAKDHCGIAGSILGESQSCNLPLTRRDAEEGECPRGDLNPHALSRALAPQASASTYSATRTCGCSLRNASEL